MTCIYFSRNIVITPYDICVVLTNPSRVEESFQTVNAHSLFQSNPSAPSKKNECIKSMVQKLSTDTDVIADGSRTYYTADGGREAQWSEGYLSRYGKDLIQQLRWNHNLSSA